MASFITVDIPGTSASKSKFQRKGWKCWAKLVTGVATPAKDGFSWSGDFLKTGAPAEVEVGSVILHYDDGGSHGVGIAYIRSDGSSGIHWVASATSGWATALAGEARDLLAMTPEERIRLVAARRIENAERDNLKDDARAYYQAIVDAGKSNPPDDQQADQIVDLSNVPTDQLIAELRRRGV